MTRRRSHASDFVEAYTSGLTPEDLHRLFTRDTRDAYRFFARNVDYAALEGLPWYRRAAAHVRLFFVAFTMKLSPARRTVYAIALLSAAIGLLKPFNFGDVTDGAGWLFLAFALVNLLVLLEVADRLSLKNDLEVAREIQNAMLPSGLYTAPGVEIVGVTRPANTVGGDFYDILPLADGRLVVALGDVSGKGSPAALLMALLIAMLRTLVQSIEDEGLEPAELVSRLNVQVTRHAPGNRFITLFCGVFNPMSGELQYVNAGHTPPLIVDAGGHLQRLTEGGIALGMFALSQYKTGRVLLQPDELIAVYSDGITEAESPLGRPFDERGLEAALTGLRPSDLPELAHRIVAAVEAHTGDVRLADDLTILLLRRSIAATPAGV
jgi:sigma-B regulation protein RsbU (phosphoserine phosphatase)